MAVNILLNMACGFFCFFSYHYFWCLYCNLPQYCISTCIWYMHVRLCESICMHLSVCLSVYLSPSCFFVFLSFDGSKTLIKINIRGFAGVFPQVLWFSHSPPGMFGIGSLLPFPRLDPKKKKKKNSSPDDLNPYSKAQHTLSLSLTLSLPPSVPFQFYIT